jgi:hypothetical protein
LLLISEQLVEEEKESFVVLVAADIEGIGIILKL